MCGIAGVISPKAIDLKPVIERMTAQLAHRGPDDSGTFVGEAVALGHRRLSILDLSSAGHQPMRNSDGRYILVFNGEIYNFATLRDELEQLGYTFVSETDTEVILSAYAAWGKGCVRRFNGMFALAIYDKEERSVFIARDRLGIKPLYYAQKDDGTLLFASEVRALLHSRLLPRRLNRAALPLFLMYQTVPTPETLVEGVRLLPPGHTMQVSADGRVQVDHYWHFLEDADVSAQRLDAATVQREIRIRLESAVARRLISDVPLGAFLSGGIDSSAIVALMSRASNQRVKTFTVAFEAAGFEDGRYSRLVADRFDTDHTEVVLTTEDLLALVPRALAAQDHPSADGINTYIVSGAARAAGLTVALSGLGGDELFAGYSTFKRVAHQQRWRFLWRVFPDAMRRHAGDLLHWSIPSVATDKLRTLLGTDGSMAEVYPIKRQYFSAAQVRRLLPAAGSSVDHYAVMLKDAFAQYDRAPLLSKISFAEARTYMHDVLLRDTDQMSMVHGLEVRVPLLDHELAEFVAGVPDVYKHPNSTPKRLMVESLRDLLPEEVIKRRKQGFIMPFDSWMRGPLRETCRENLQIVAELPEFDASVIRGLWDAFEQKKPSVSWSRLWLLVTLGKWYAETLHADCYGAEAR